MLPYNLICGRTYFWQQTYRWYCCYDEVYCLWCMPISTTPQTEVTLSQSDWHKVGSVDGGSANRRSRKWRSKMPGKTKHSWSTISSEHQVNRRSVNRRSNLIWLEMEKPDLTLLCLRKGSKRPPPAVFKNYFCLALIPPIYFV